MADAISKETFNHLVQLAALELTPQEAEYLLRELNNQLNAIRELESIPLDANIPITSHGVPYTPQITPPARWDEWIPFPRPEDILAQAPETDENYIVVPEIPHTELS
jgi:aspartyl/glutamyl-tRNA(Asn/Gln) amidotransferase C subunit